MRFLVLLSLVGLAAAGGIPDKMMDMVKDSLLRADCWGEDSMNEWYMNINAAADKCHKMELELTMQDLFGDFAADVTKSKFEMIIVFL